MFILAFFIPTVHLDLSYTQLNLPAQNTSENIEIRSIILLSSTRVDRDDEKIADLSSPRAICI
jgi:hypothetical protein